MSFGGSLYVPGPTPAPAGIQFGVRRFNGRIPPSLFIENQAMVFLSYSLNSVMRSTRRPAILRQPFVIVKVLLRRAGSDKERDGRPRESLLLDRHERSEPGISFVAVRRLDDFLRRSRSRNTRGDRQTRRRRYGDDLKLYRENPRPTKRNLRFHSDTSGIERTGTRPQTVRTNTTRRPTCYRPEAEDSVTLRYPNDTGR